MERAARATVRVARAAPPRVARAVTRIHIPTAVERVERDLKEVMDTAAREAKSRVVVIR